MNRWERVSVEEGVYAVSTRSEAYTTGSPGAIKAFFEARKQNRPLTFPGERCRCSPTVRPLYTRGD